MLILYLETSETLFAEVLDKFRYPGSRGTGYVDDLHNHSGQLYAQLALAHPKNPNPGLALDMFRRAEKGHPRFLPPKTAGETLWALNFGGRDSVPPPHEEFA